MGRNECEISSDRTESLDTCWTRSLLNPNLSPFRGGIHCQGFSLGRANGSFSTPLIPLACTKRTSVNLLHYTESIFSAGLSILFLHCALCLSMDPREEGGGSSMIRCAHKQTKCFTTEFFLTLWGFYHSVDVIQEHKYIHVSFVFIPLGR